MREAAARQPVPVLWLLGTTQSGKTSLVRALTGSTRAEIGDGFRPCTRTARLYEFPAAAPVVAFLDTRGLGEVEYAADEDLALCEARAHLVIAVVKVTESKPGALLEVLHAVRRRHPEWPVVVAQTCLHDTYEHGMEHVTPYPFDGPGWEARVPADLGRLLQAQRAAFADLPGTGEIRCVPVDFTPPEDGFVPADYGLDALWAAIEHAAALGLRERLVADPALADAYARAAHPQVVGYSLAAATVGALPVVDLALVPSVQAGLLRALAATYRLEWSRRNTSEFLGLLGAGFALAYGLRLAGRSVVKLVPGWGQTAGAVWGATANGATTYALGKAACVYLARRREGRATEAAMLQAEFRAALRRGRTLMREQPAGRGPGAAE